MKNILLIDDDRTLTKKNMGFLMCIFSESARILVSHTAKQALEFAKKFRIDIFVVDILGLSYDMDGVELAELLRKEGYSYPVPIIITSKKKNDTYKNEVHKRIKFFDYITKPYTLQELAGQVKSASIFLDDQPKHYFEIQYGSTPYVQESNKISHIEKVYDKRKIAIYRRDENGKPLSTHTVPIVSFKSFVEESVKNTTNLIQCHGTAVVNLYWVEGYCPTKRCVILRMCGTKIPVDKKFRKLIEKLLPRY